MNLPQSLLKQANIGDVNTRAIQQATHKRNPTPTPVVRQQLSPDQQYLNLPRPTTTAAAPGRLQSGAISDRRRPRAAATSGGGDFRRRRSQAAATSGGCDLGLGRSQFGGDLKLGRSQTAGDLGQGRLQSGSTSGRSEISVGSPMSLPTELGRIGDLRRGGWLQRG